MWKKFCFSNLNYVESFHKILRSLFSWHIEATAA